jgi:transposase
VVWCAVARISELLVKFGKSGNEIKELLLQVYGDNAMEKTAGYRWVIHFSERRESVTDEERSGRPATSKTEEHFTKVCQIMRENLQPTVRSITEQTNIDRETVWKVVTEDLDMRNVCAKMVPKGLTKEHCL